MIPNDIWPQDHQCRLGLGAHQELFPVVSLADIAEEAPSHSWSAATSEVYGPMEPTASVPRRAGAHRPCPAMAVACLWLKGEDERP